MLLRRVRAERADRARRSLHEFTRQAWHAVEPATDFIDTWHIGAVCAHLQAVLAGDIQRLVINIPPGHLKSILVAVMFPAWAWVGRPGWRALFSSYSDTLATRDSIRCRNVITSEWYARAFAPEWSLSADQNTKDHYTNTRGGSRQATGVKGTTTGVRAHAAIVDDPHNILEAHSEAARKAAILWWDQGISSRLDKPREASRIIVMQRLHADDLAGRALDLGYEALILPSEYDPARSCVTYRRRREGDPPHGHTNGHANGHTPSRPNGAATAAKGPPATKADDPGLVEFWRDPRKEAGELLFPAEYPEEVLAVLRRELAEDGYAAQCLQSPTPAGGSILKLGYWRFWKPDGVQAEEADAHVLRRPDGCHSAPARPVALDKLVRWTISVDAAFKGLETSSRVSITVWAAQGADRYLIDRRTAVMDFTETLQALRATCADWPRAKRKLIEDKANGPAIISALQREIAGLIPVSPSGGKEARAWA